MVFLIELSSPNHISRNNKKINAIILKSEVGEDKQILDKLLHPGSEESSHFLISEKGEVYKLISENQAALSLGTVSWRGDDHFDLGAIFITLSARVPGEFTQVQKDVLAELMQEKIDKYEIPAQNIVSVCDASFINYTDFGFPWQELANKGIGLWPKTDIEINNEENLLTILSNIGYAVNIPSYKVAITAFQKHFMPDNITGEDDEKTIKTAIAVQKIF